MYRNKSTAFIGDNLNHKPKIIQSKSFFRISIYAIGGDLFGITSNTVSLKTCFETSILVSKLTKLHFGLQIFLQMLLQ